MLDSKDGELARLSSEKIMEEVRQRARLKVNEVMVPVDCSVDHDDHIIKVVYEMNSNKVALLPVMKEGQVVGVIRSIDVFHQFAKLIL
jgi:signal-transduction protein with cAMP-binding, CBS, and nucleotidyltransferase domain